MTKDKKHQFDRQDYGPEARKILEGLEPAKKRPEVFITGDDIPRKPTTIDDLPEPDRQQARDFLDDVRRTGQRPKTAKEIAIETAARDFHEPRPMPTPSGSRPTRSADDPPTSPKPKR
ncbi:hypothetical protein G8E10_24925 [Rhizobiaceae bacterium CRRU44]|uniref:Uncharacterized protein n=1 Tax=Ferranicluibacter rubi TaxID=2715133 RepID=A0AA44CF91_9HYPH|nr:hypothetical protein [Ferranicluibacter rubi]NHT78947.1 hypothetical protein [Ferranicluibacter rubi]